MPDHLPTKPTKPPATTPENPENLPSPYLQNLQNLQTPHAGIGAGALTTSLLSALDSRLFGYLPRAGLPLLGVCASPVQVVVSTAKLKIEHVPDLVLAFKSTR